MILQSKLDLSTFEIIRFRIWNQTSNPDDYGIGTKYFNTNSGHDGYNRENIYTDTGWRKTAYLDDIDKITNGEGSLGTRVKALEDMLNVDSAETVVSTWEEIQAFLDNVKEGTDLMTMLDGKLDRTGGTIKGAGDYRQYVLTLDTNDEYYTILRLQSRGVVKGSFLWTSDTLSGDSFAGIRLQNEITKDAIGIDEGGTPRYNSNTLLHSGNVGDYTAGAANRLANKVSLWGNEFDGTQSLSGNITVRNNNGLLGTKSDTTTVTPLVILNNQNIFYLGTDDLYNKDISTRIYGKTIDFRTSGTAAMTITEEGNVLVGASYISATLPAPKMSVHGGLLCVQAVGSALSLNSLPERGLALGGNGHALSQYLENSGNFAIQAHFTNDGTTRALNLNPLGGAVNVGEGGLNVNGTIKSGDKFLLTTTSMNLGSATTPLYLFLARPDANYIWASANGGYINLGVYDTGTINSANATLSIYSDRVVSGQRNNAVSLGSSSYRWSNVYSTLGNFLGRVLIGGAEDDGSTDLQVDRDIRVGNVASNLLRTSIIRGYTNYYGRGGGYILGSNFYNNDGSVSLAFAGILGTDSTLGYYAIGSDISNLWFRINSTESNFNVLTKFNGGALIPTGQKLTIGSVTFEEDADGRVKVDGDMYTTGTLASGGKAKEGTGTGSGSANVRDFELPADGKTTYDCDHLLKSKNVIVQVFEKAIQNYIEVWEMILTDVTIVTEDRVTVTFGRPTTKVHKVHIIGGNVS